MTHQNEKQIDRLLEVVGFYRGMVLDACEVELADSPRWQFLRSRLLKIFGSRGFESKILEIMTEGKEGRHEQD